MPGADRDHVLERARHLAADDVGVRVDAERRREEQLLQLRRRLPASAHRDDRRGRLARRDLAREVRAGEHADAARGRDRRAPRRSPRSSAAACPARCPWPGSRSPRRGRCAGRASASTARRPCDGTAITTTSAPRARLGEVGGRVQARRAARCRAGSRGSRASASMRAGELGAARPQHGRRVPATIAATAVPHEPAPTTATRVTRVLPVRARGLGIAPPPRRRRPRRSCRVDLAGPGDALDDRGHDPIGRLASRARRAASTIGSPTTAVCATPHCQCGLAALGEDPVRSPQPDRRDRHAAHAARAAPCPTCRPSARGPARSCPRGTRRRTRRRASASTAAVERVGGVGAAPADRDLVRGAQQRAEHRLVEQLGLGEEPHVPAAAVGDVRERQRVEIRHVVAREDHRARRRDVARAPSIVQRRPHRNQGQNTPFATEYTGSTLGSIRRPCRPGAFPTPQASSSRCGRSHSARPASRTRSTTTRAERSRARWPSASSPRPAPDRS